MTLLMKKHDIYQVLIFWAAIQAIRLYSSPPKADVGYRYYPGRCCVSEGFDMKKSKLIVFFLAEKFGESMPPQKSL